MDDDIKRKILGLLDQRRIMTIAPLPPQQQSIPLPMPTAADVRIFRVGRMLVSVLGRAKGFAHTDLVAR
jgi:hypothetical protein